MIAPLFVLLALLTVAASLVVVLHRNPVYSALGLVATLFMLAVLFVGLDAHLVAALQIIVYAGAIVVLFLFVIMLLNLQVEPRTLAPAPLVVTGAVLGGALGVAALGVLGRDPLPLAAVVGPGYGGAEALAERLFTAYIVPFELTSVLLLVAIIGAVVLGKKRLS